MWPTEEQTFTYDSHIMRTSSRFYKGYVLHYVFDYTLGSGTNWYSPSAITVYAKWFEHNNWHSASQQVRHANGHGFGLCTSA